MQLNNVIKVKFTSNYFFHISATYLTPPKKIPEIHKIHTSLKKSLSPPTQIQNTTIG